MKQYKLIHGDCLKKLAKLPDNSVDAIVTDPPYGISFLNAAWDYSVPQVPVWEQCLRVLKPGGRLLCFSGSRTYHRVVINIEDAGFEIIDQILWVYGGGFPKNFNVSRLLKESNADLALREKYKGYGTALRPAHEPIALARKPLTQSIVDTVTEHGTGVINIGACKIPVANGEDRWPTNFILNHHPECKVGKKFNKCHIDCVVKSMEKQSPGASSFFYCAKVNRNERDAGLAHMPDLSIERTGNVINLKENLTASGKIRNVTPTVKNNHPTVKPVRLMTYLCRLITPPNGIVLDPFMGSGSTGKAAMLEGFRFIGIELDETYYNIARERIQHAVNVKPKKLF
jgi:DNA modification methylase